VQIQNSQQAIPNRSKSIPPPLMRYEPISYDAHLARGYCCYDSRNQHSRCVFCPWAPIKPIPQMTIDPRILEAMRSGEVTTIQSERMSLVPQLTIGSLTIIYKEYQH
jgi:hypothetical protein